MLHGAKITDSKPLKSSRLFEQASGEFATFHLSAAVLDTTPKTDAKIKVAVKLEEKYKGAQVTLAVLSNKSDMAALDLYVNCTQEVTLMLVDAPKGTEVSLSGYFEPKGDDMDDDMFNYGQEGEDEDAEGDDSDSEDDEDAKLVVKGKKIENKQDKASIADSLKAASANSKKNAVSTAVVDEDDSEDASEDDVEELDMDEDDDDDSDEPVVAAPVKKDTKKHAVKVVEDSDDDDEEDEDDKLVDMSDDSEDEEIDLEQVMKNASKKAKTSGAPAGILKKP